MICKIADFVFDFKKMSSDMESFLNNYKSDDIPQFTVEVTEQEIEELCNIIPIPTNRFQAEINAVHRKALCHIAPYNAFFLHAALIQANGVGIAFTALSGTGKTTHTLLWRKLLGDKMEIINGDKPIIRFIDNIPYGYGTPWCGKEGLGKNSKVPIKHLCFIERSENNSCETLTAKDALNRIFNQIFVPRDPTIALKTLELLDKFLNKVDIWLIKCNTDISAAEIAYNTIFKGELQ